MSALDRPVWMSLSTSHSALSLGDDLARRYAREVNLFASARDDTMPALTALADLVQPGERVFVLQWRGRDPESSVFLSQRDVRELQFAKASIATGWNILLAELGVSAADVSQVLLAGSFGAYLTPLSAVRIGLVPRIALPRIVSAGNVAGEGAKIAALSVRERAEAHSILREVEYVELSGRADFNDMFVDQLSFPG